jgi:polyhydroxyalkanoate synthesis regulator phasin
MSEDRQRILKMVAEGKISVAEAEGLLDALASRSGVSVSTGGAATASVSTMVRPVAPEPEGAPAPGKRRSCRFLRVVVAEQGREKVNIRVPMQLIRAGMKLKGLIPADAREKVNSALHDKGVSLDIDAMTGTVEEIVEQLQGLEVNVDDDGDSVRVFCE